MTIRFSLWLRGITVLLLLQLILGVWINLYGTFPATSNVATAVKYLHDPEFSVHVALAVLLVLIAFVVALYAFRSDAPPRLRWYTLGGFLALLVGYEAGVELIMSGFSSNLYSGLMALAWLVAIAFYGLGQMELRRAARAPGAVAPPASPA